MPADEQRPLRLFYCWVVLFLCTSYALLRDFRHAETAARWVWTVAEEKKKNGTVSAGMSISGRPQKPNSVEVTAESTEESSLTSESPLPWRACWPPRCWPSPHWPPLSTTARRSPGTLGASHARHKSPAWRLALGADCTRSEPGGLRGLGCTRVRP